MHKNNLNKCIRIHLRLLCFLHEVDKLNIFLFHHSCQEVIDIVCKSEWNEKMITEFNLESDFTLHFKSENIF